MNRESNNIENSNPNKEDEDVIDKNAMQGLISFGSDLETALKEEAHRIGKTLPASQKRKSATFSDVEDEDTSNSQPVKRTPASHSKPHTSVQETPLSVVSSIPKPNITTFEKIVEKTGVEMLLKVGVAVLLLVLGMNCLLFLKLWSLEDMSIRLSTNPDDVNSLPLDRLPKLAQQDFVRLLKHQEALHRTEIEKWREALGDVLSLFQTMEGSLSNLQKVVDSYSTSRILRESFNTEVDSKYKKS